MELLRAGQSCREFPASASLGMVGIWRLTSRMHRGPWADLYLAQPADAAGSPRTDYVVKIARPSQSQPSEAAGQIAAEVAAAAAVCHPNVVAVLDASLTAAQPYCVTPRLEGGTLLEFLNSQRMPELPVALWWARQCAQGLTALHAAGWVHRDLKPSNLILSPRGHLTLIDLGFAALAHSPCQDVFRGTAAYAAPEMLRRDAVVQAASDLYALGCILGQMTGVQPKPAKQQRTGQQPSAAQPKRHDGPPVPQPVAELIDGLTDDQPARRPTAPEVVDRLLRLEIETLGRHISPRGVASPLAA